MASDAAAPASRAPVSVEPPSVASAATPSIAPPTAAPASQPPAALFVGDRPTVPPAFEGVTPDMPMVAAKVLIPSLNQRQIVNAPFANLRLQVLGDAERVFSLSVESVAPDVEPSGAALRALMVERWGPGEQTKDDSRQVLTIWHGDGLRVRHRQNIEGTATILFDRFMTIEQFVEGPFMALRGALGKPLDAARRGFEFTAERDGGVEILLPALDFGQPTTALLTADAAGQVEQVMIHLSFALRPAARDAILAGLTKAWGKPASTRIDATEQHRFGRILVESKADKWRVILKK